MDRSLSIRHFSTPADVELSIKEVIDKLPIEDGERKISEFGILAIGNDKLNQLVIPQNIVVLKADFQSSEATIPQISIAADGKNNLYMIIKAHKKGFTQRVSILIPSNEFYFNADIWEMFTEEGKSILFQLGFEPE